MKRSGSRASLALSVLIGVSAFGGFVGCDSNSADAPSAAEWGAESGASSDPEPAAAGAGGAAVCLPDPPALPSAVPAGLAVDETATLLRSLHAVGTQNYRCTETASAADAEPTFAWVFVAPVADLFNSCGTKVGSHFAVPDSLPPVPEWRYEVDGSSVTGLKLSSAPVEGSIPELLLKENGHAGDGVFAGVTFVQRLHTLGGAAPAAADCTAAHVDEVSAVAYSAQYYFYAGGN